MGNDTDWNGTTSFFWGLADVAIRSFLPPAYPLVLEITILLLLHAHINIIMATLPRRKWHHIWFYWDSFFCCIYIWLLHSQTCTDLLLPVFQSRRFIPDVISQCRSNLNGSVASERLPSRMILVLAMRSCCRAWWDLVSVSVKRFIFSVSLHSTGYFTQISTLADVQENVMEYLHVLSRPKVIDQEHDTVWTEAYIDSTVSSPRRSLLNSLNPAKYNQLLHCSQA